MRRWLREGSQGCKRNHGRLGLRRCVILLGFYQRWWVKFSISIRIYKILEVETPVQNEPLMLILFWRRSAKGVVGVLITV